MSRRSDSGFTLPEVLVTIVLIGLIAGVLSAVFSVVVRTRPAAEARVDDARSLLGITNWFPADVNSTPVQPDATASPDWWNVDPSAPSGCGGAPAGTNLIRLRWVERSGPTRTFEANYRLVDDGGWRIVRVSCEVGGAADVLRLTSALPEPSTTPVVVDLRRALIDVNGVDVLHVVGASMTITTADGDTLRVDSLSENPNASLPPPPTAVTTSSTPTSLPNFPPVAGNVSVNLTIGAPAFALDLPVSDPDTSPPTLTYTSNTNTSPDLVISQTGALQLQLEAPTGTAGSISSFTYQVTDGTSVATGTIVVTLQASGPPGTTTSSTTTTTTTVPCSVGTMTIAPATVENQPKNNGNNDTSSQLTEQVTVTVGGLNGNCDGLQLRWSFKADPYPASQEQSELFGDPLAITFESLATERWDDGTHTMYLFDSLRGVALGVSRTLVVT